MSDINLLPQKNIGFFSEERLLLFSKIGAVVSVVLVLSLSILFFLLSRDPSIIAVKNEESRIIAQLTLLQSKTAKYLIIVDRINKIKILQKTKSNFDQSIATFVKQIPDGVSITNFVLDQKTVSIAVSASDVSLLGKTVDNFITLISSKKVLKNVTVEGLVSDEKGGKYVLTISGDLL